MKTPNPSLSIKDQKRRERTLLLSWMLSAWAPAAIGYSFYLSGSGTLFADLLRRSIELTSLFLNWAIYRKIIHAAKPVSVSQKLKLEKTAAQFVAFTMCVSFVVIVINAIMNLISPKPMGDFRLGLLFASLGAIVNSLFWYRNYQFTKQQHSRLFDAQWKLYRMKTILDGNVIIILVSSFFIQDQPWAHLIDSIGSLIIGSFLLISALRILKKDPINPLT